MKITTRTLGRGLAVAALVLVVVVVGFIGYAHYKARKYLMGLPGKLGVDIRQETNGFTYSQSVGGKTVFTVHAAKEVQRKDGKVTLHDVGMVLYGRKGDRADRIHGEEFEYDQATGVMRAVGDVYMDLAGPPGKPGAAGSAPGQTERMDEDKRVIHVKTSGLVFKQKEKYAETDGAIEFRAGGMTGTAVGASYDADAGVVVLRQSVRVSGLRGAGPERTGGESKPVVLTASRAELDRAGNVLRLAGPKYVGMTERGSQTMSAAEAVVLLTPDGTPERVQAQGKVTLAGEGRGVMYGERMEAELNEAGGLRAGHLWGGVRFLSDRAAGNAGDVRVSFDGAGKPTGAVLTGRVEMESKGGKGGRRVEAERVTLKLGGGGRAKVEVRGAEASGGDGAMVRMIDATTKGGEVRTGVRGDVLTARFAGAKVVGVDGIGKTLVERVTLDAKGAMVSKERSTGERLTLDLKPGPGKKMELARAVQRGGVEAMREAVGKKGVETEHAKADEGVYDAAKDTLTMVGGVQVQDAASALYADRVEMDQQTGNSVSTGVVRVSYLQPGGPKDAEPVHVVGGRAVARKSSGLTEFTAPAGGRVRMWQGGSQVEAAVIDLDKEKKTVVARGDGGVRAVLAQGKGAGKGPVKVQSREMVYTDGLREVEFHGDVRVDDKDGVMRMAEAMVFLASAAAGDGTGFLGGKVEKMVGTGAVEMEQAGRVATGEKLVYTAGDGVFVLTGTKVTPPKVVDEARGTITGGQLRFRTGDDSVVVLGGGEDGPGRVKTEIRVRQ